MILYSFHEELKSEFLYGKKEETERTNVENVLNTDVTIEEDTPYNFETRKFSYDDSEDGFSDF